jgi:hypothetical protein
MEETYDEESYDESYVSNDSVMTGFFDLDIELKRLELRWKGLIINNGEIIRVADPIASDEFINSVINSLKSTANQVFSISYLSKREANNIILEKDIAIYKSVAEEGIYFQGDFDLFKEDVDHFLQLFMGHVINGHGINAATSLQAGVVAEKQIETGKKKESLLEISKNILLDNKENEDR